METPSEDTSDEARAELVVETLAARFPGRFSAEEREKLRGQVKEMLAASTRLRAFPLTNADEPAPIFHAAAEG